MRLGADNVTDYADTLVMQARSAGYALDFSERSIANLEQYFRMSDDLLQTSALTEQQRNLIVFYGGCYLGEVLARHMDGVWSFAENWFDSTIVFRTRAGGIQIQPFHKVYLRVTETPANHSLAAYSGELREKIAAAETTGCA